MDGSWQVNPVGRPSRAGHRIRIILQTADAQAAGVDLGVLEILDRDDEQDAVGHRPVADRAIGLARGATDIGQ